MTEERKWRALRRRIEDLSLTTKAEIQAYPAPIPACDAQFNYLLERRRMLAGELARLDGAESRTTVSVDDFIHSSPLSDELAQPAQVAGKPRPDDR